MAGQKTFVVVEPQALVQADLAQAILEICPGATVLRAVSAAHALALLAAVDRLDGAIVDLAASTLKDSGLAGRIARLGGWIVCLAGRQGEDLRAEGWHPLVSPFSTDDVMLSLGAALGISRGAPG